MSSNAPRVCAYGGGLDSFAMLLNAIERGEKPDAAVFCDVGDGAADRDGQDPGEWPSTYRHLREVVIPLCRYHGVEFVWLSSEVEPVRGARSLFAWLKERQQIPVSGPNRLCTRIAKVERFEAWLERRYPGQEVEVWVGFEAGEEQRADKDPNAGSTTALRRNRFPLMELGFCRCRCEAYVRELGYPIPRKSACTFCPYASKGDWQTLARELPLTFEQIVQLEAAKPPTARNGIKLSIMGYRAKKNPLTRQVISIKAPCLPEFIKGAYRRRIDLCKVCGQRRASKATGCDYLVDGDSNLAQAA
jgi:hypothetical protein